MEKFVDSDFQILHGESVVELHAPNTVIPDFDNTTLILTCVLGKQQASAPGVNMLAPSALFIPSTALPLSSRAASRLVSPCRRQQERHRAPPPCMAKKRAAKPNSKANKSNNNKKKSSSTTKTSVSGVGTTTGLSEDDGVGFGNATKAASVDATAGGRSNILDSSNTSEKPKSKSGDSNDDEGPYIPRGPTLRAEYERSGIIDPVAMDRDAGTLPEAVANRMIRRIVTFGGTPLLLLFAFFALYFVLKYKYDITVLPVVVASSTLGSVGLATAGITYGILSSSWDDDEGSALGWKEFKVNFMRARDGVASAVAREKKEDELDRIDELADAMEKEDKKTGKADNKPDDDKTS